MRQVGGHVMLEAVLADVAQQFLQLRNAHHARAAERIERIVGELAFADVAAGCCRSRSLVEKRAKLMGPAFTRPTQVPKVFSLPTVPAMICWKSMRTSLKKCLGRLLQWKQTALSGSSP